MDLPITVTVRFVAAAVDVRTKSPVRVVPVIPLLFQNLAGNLYASLAVEFAAVADPLVTLISSPYMVAMLTSVTPSKSLPSPSVIRTPDETTPAVVFALVGAAVIPSPLGIARLVPLSFAYL